MLGAILPAVSQANGQIGDSQTALHGELIFKEWLMVDEMALKLIGMTFSLFLLLFSFPLLSPRSSFRARFLPVFFP